MGDDPSVGKGWWFDTIDYEHLNTVAKSWLDSNFTFILLYSESAIAACWLAPHFLTPKIIMAEEIICRSNGYGGVKIRERMKEIARDKGATHLMIDNAYAADLRDLEERDEKTIKSGFDSFSTRYVQSL